MPEQAQQQPVAPRPRPLRDQDLTDFAALSDPLDFARLTDDALDRYLGIVSEEISDQDIETLKPWRNAVDELRTRRRDLASSLSTISEDSRCLPGRDDNQCRTHPLCAHHKRSGVATLTRALRVLNELLAADPVATAALVNYRVPVNAEVGKHPTIQVGYDNDSRSYTVGLIGILNGIFGCVPGTNAGRIVCLSDRDAVKSFTGYGERETT